MKKIIIGILIIFITFTGGVFASYTIAKKQAKLVAQSFPGNLSPLNTQLYLYGDPDLKPCWIFRAEYVDVMTGATFDVSVSFSGSVLEIPPMSKMPE